MTIYDIVAAVGEEACMPLEFSYEGFVFRVDGDVLEIFRRGAFSERVPLAWLAVQVQSFARGRLAVRIVSASRDAPLYEAMQKAKPAPGSALELFHHDRGRAPLPAVLHPGGTVVRSPRSALTRSGPDLGTV
jgi:hypothetical protein